MDNDLPELLRVPLHRITVSNPETRSNRTPHSWIVLGALLAAVAVGAGAFGAHGLKARLTSDQLAIWETAVRYHMYHAIAIVLVGLVGTTGNVRKADQAGWLFFLGILVFSGCLYALALTDLKVLGAVVPLGGTAFILGWIQLARCAKP